MQSTTRFLVIGAGPTGIGAATRLAELDEDYLVVDSSDRVGGMAASITDPEGFTWDLGGHVLHSHFPEFDKAIAVSGVTLNQVTRNGWVWLEGTGPETLVPTPVQQHLTELPTDLRPDAPAAHLGDYYRNSFGQDLYDRFFEPFNVKMWTTPLDLVDHQWTSLRNGSGERNVPTLALATGVKPAAERFPYPAGGTGALWKAIHDRMLEPERVHLNTRVQSLDLERRVAELDDGRTVSYEYCISAAPITTAMRWSGQEDLSAGLRASTLHAVGLGYRGNRRPRWPTRPGSTAPTDASRGTGRRCSATTTPATPARDAGTSCARCRPSARSRSPSKRRSATLPPPCKPWGPTPGLSRAGGTGRSRWAIRSRPSTATPCSGR